MPYTTDRHGDFLNTSFDDFIKQPSAPQSPIGGVQGLHAEGMDMIAVSITLVIAVYVAWRMARYFWPRGTQVFLEWWFPKISDSIIEQPEQFSVSKAVVVCLLFLYFKGVVDTFTGIHGDNALNFVMGAGSLLFVIMICSPKWHQTGLLWGGFWMLLRGALNVIMFMRTVRGDMADVLLTLPLAALPNFAISFVIPFVVGGILLKAYRRASPSVRSPA